MDYTLVVDTTGLDERTWLTLSGYPHSVNAHVQERYTRMSHNDLKLTVTVDDPKMFTKLLALGTATFRWIPNQPFDEWFCILSEQAEYSREMGDRADFVLGGDIERFSRPSKNYLTSQKKAG